MDIYSPNHVEFLSIFGSDLDTSGTADAMNLDVGETPSWEFSKALIEGLAKDLVELLSRSSGSGDISTLVIILCAEHGSFAVSMDYQGRWFPAYHGTVDSRAGEKVVDATGAGNAFLGAFTAEFAETGDVVRGMVSGSVAANFVVEQAGVPSLTPESPPGSLGLNERDGSSFDREMWNGVRFSERVEEYTEWLEIHSPGLR